LKRASQKEKDTILKIIYKKRLTVKDLKTVLGFVKSYGSINYTISKAKEAVEKAKESLVIFSDSEYKTGLIDIANYITERKL